MGRIAKSFKWIVLLAVAAASVLSLIEWYNGTSNNKSYKELQLQVDAQVLPDGSMYVRETRVLDFQGEFTRYRRQIPHQGYGKIIDVAVSEPQKNYVLATAPNNKLENHFTISKTQATGIEQDVIELYFQAQNQKRTFIIEYRLTDVVAVHKDVAELYWKFIGAGRSLPITMMSVTLTVPTGASVDKVKVWGHGPAQGTVQKISGSQFAWQTSNLPPDRFLEGRVIFPPELVPQAAKHTSKMALPVILADEQHWADLRAQEQREAFYIVAGSASIALFGIVAGFLIYFRFGRRYKSAMEVDYFRELPAQYTPAEVACLVDNGMTRPQAIAATFLDLARRGYLRMQPAYNSSTEDVLIYKLKSADETLTDHERLLLEFFFERIGNMQSPVWFSALKNYRKSNSVATAAFISAFKLSVEKAVTLRGFLQTINRGRKIAGMLFCIGLAGLIISWGMVWFHFIAAFAIVCISMLTSMVHCRKLTDLGQQQYDLWQAFRRFLKDFSNLDQAQIPQLILWEHYLVYAVALGVAQEVIKQLPIIYPQVNDPSTNFAPYWGGMYHSSYGADGSLQNTSYSGISSFDGVVNSIETTWTDAYSAVSSSTLSSIGSAANRDRGEGGGFSGGGGGGGGGGSGDAD